MTFLRKAPWGLRPENGGLDLPWFTGRKFGDDPPNLVFHGFLKSRILVVSFWGCIPIYLVYIYIYIHVIS